MGSTNRSDPTAEKDSTVSDSGKLISDENFSMVHSEPKFNQALMQETKFNTEPRFGSMFMESSSSSEASKPTKRKTENPLRHYSTEDKIDKEDESDDVGEEKVELGRGADALDTIHLSDQSEESELGSSSDVEEGDIQGEEEPEAQVQCLQPTMMTMSRHSFDSDQDKPVFTISVMENMKEDYGLFVWPSSIILAEYVWQQRSRFIGATVVELGAGTSLPGLVAAKLGSDVTLTDDASRLEVLDNIRRVCVLNDLNCKVMGLTWGVWDESIFSLSPDLVIGADVLYNASAFDDLFATVSFLLQKKSPGSVFITTYHNRSGHHLIEFLMLKWGLKCSKVIDGFSILPPGKASAIRGSNIQLAEICLS